MAKTYRNSGELLAEHAMRPDQATQGERAQDTSKGAPQRRLIYNGTMPVPPEGDLRDRTMQPPSNRKFTKRKVSPFNFILILLGTAAATVLYIGNIIAVDQLVSDIHKSDVRLQEILNDQAMMRARINQMSSLERIRKRAEDELGLKDPADVPGWINVDQDKIRTIEEVSREH